MQRGDVYVFLAEYDSLEEARTDYRALGDLHGSGVAGVLETATFDAAIVSREAEGVVLLIEEDTPLHHATWRGAAVGAVVEMLFPPVARSDGPDARLDVACFRRGISDAGVGDLSRILDVGEAGIVVVADDAVLVSVLEQNLVRARATIEKGLRPQRELVHALDRS
jgi:hypothetical protein